VDVPGTTPALRLGPPDVPAPETLLVVDEPFAVDPKGLVGADGPVAGVEGVALGRDITVDGNVIARVLMRLALFCWSRPYSLLL
jgi:hypothetical protein